MRNSDNYNLQVQYLEKWKGYSGFHNSWEDEENLTTDLVRYCFILIILSYNLRLKSLKLSEYETLKKKIHCCKLYCMNMCHLRYYAISICVTFLSLRFFLLKFCDGLVKKTFSRKKKVLKICLHNLPSSALDNSASYPCGF